MFRFERTVETVDDQLDDFEHQPFIPRDFGVGVEPLIQDEVEVSFERVSVNDAVAVPVFVDQPLQFDGRLGQRVERERDVFDERGCSGFAHAADRRENPGAHRPPRPENRRILRKFDREKERETVERALNFGDLRRERFRRLRFRFEQNGGRVGPERRNELLNARPAFDRAQRFAVEEFRANDRRFLQDLHRPASVAERFGKDHRAGATGRDFFGFESRFGQEREGSFGADKQMRDRFERVVERDQRSQIQPGNVFNPIFAFDERGQLGVGANLRLNLRQPLQELRLFAGELGAARFVPDVENRPVGEDQPSAFHHFVAVGVRPAVHPGRVVPDDSADSRRVDRRRVRGEFAPVLR